MSGRRFRVGLLALAVLSGWLWAGAVAEAQPEPIVVEGRVVNGTPGSGGVDGLTVALHQEGVATSRIVDTITDAEGRFRFEGVAFDPSLLYVLSVRYQGALYGTALDLSNGPPPPVLLTVYEASSDEELLSVSAASVLFAQVDRSNQMIAALEIVNIVNDSNRTYAPGARAMEMLRFGLPPGAQDLQVDTGLPGADFLQVDRGFALLASVPPGEHEVMYTYRFPYSEAEFSFDRSLNYGAGRMRVLAPLGLMSLSSEELGVPETVTVGQSPYQLLEASELPRDSRISVALEDLPMPSLAERLGRRVDSVRFEYAAPVALGLLMVLLIAYAFKRRSGLRRGGAAEGRESSVLDGELETFTGD